MKRLAALTLVLCLVLSLCACGGAPVEETDPVVISTEAPTEAPTELPAQPQAQNIIYYVSVIDNNDNPVAGVTIRLNDDAVCDTDEMGQATFSLPGGEYTASIVSMPMGYDYADQQREFPFEEGMYRLTIFVNSTEIDPEDLSMEEGEIPEEDIGIEDAIPEG